MKKNPVPPIKGDGDLPVWAKPSPAPAQTEAATEDIAQAIIAISDAVTRMRAGRLNDKALFLLISHASGLPQRQVKGVLNAMQDLKALYLKKG